MQRSLGDCSVLHRVILAHHDKAKTRLRRRLGKAMSSSISFMGELPFCIIKHYSIPFAFLQSRTSSGVDSPCNSQASELLPRHLLLLSKTWGWSEDEALSSINKEIAKGLAKNPQLQISCLVAQTSKDLQGEASKHGINLVGAKCYDGTPPVECLSFPPEGVRDVNYVIGYGEVVGKHAPQIQNKHPNCKWVHIAQSSDESSPETALCEKADVAFAIGSDTAENIEGRLRFCEKEVVGFAPGIFSEFQNCKQVVRGGPIFSVIAFYPSPTECEGYDIPAKAVGMLPQHKYRLICVVPSPDETAKMKETMLHHGIFSKQLIIRSRPRSLETLCKLFVEADLLIMPFSPCKDEDFGLIALQAISASLPVLVSANTGLGQALRCVLFGQMCIVDSDKPKHWKKCIEAVKRNERSQRLEEARQIRDNYNKKYSWNEQCDVLLSKLVLDC